jgi:hypothetical protein
MAGALSKTNCASEVKLPNAWRAMV